MVQLATLDILIIALYGLAVLSIGFWVKDQSSSSSQFLLGGRRMTLPLFVMTLTSSWYGGILGVGEFTYLYGLSNWVVQGFPYYVFALIFAFFIAKKVRSAEHLTIPDRLFSVYDRKVGFLGALFTFLLVTPAPYILMMGVLFSLLFGWPIYLGVFLGLGLSTLYLFKGGFKADIVTDVFEFVLMYLGFALLLFFCLQYQGPSEVTRVLPQTHLSYHGGNSIQFLLVWFFIALWTMVDPSFHQRCAAAKDASTARKGILISVVFWFLFDAMTVTTGLYARALLPDLANPMHAYPALSELLLPPIVKGLFWTGMLATVMSTLNTTTFLSAMTIGRDFLWRMKKDRKDTDVVYFTRMGLVITLIVSSLLALGVRSVVQLWYAIGSCLVPGLLVPLVSSYFTKWTVRPGYAYVSMLGGAILSFTWLFIGWSREFGAYDQYPFGIEPMYPGLFVAIAVWLLGLGLGKKV